jgi:hypothetical protein
MTVEPIGSVTSSPSATVQTLQSQLLQHQQQLARDLQARAADKVLAADRKAVAEDRVAIARAHNSATDTYL